jgi:AcrR family transcriptional regulator
MYTSGAPHPDHRQPGGRTGGRGQQPRRAMAGAVFREERGQIAASLAAMTGDRDLAGECFQDAFTRALQARDDDGAPARPGARLTTAAATGLSTCCKRPRASTACGACVPDRGRRGQGIKTSFPRTWPPWLMR